MKQHSRKKIYITLSAMALAALPPKDALAVCDPNEIRFEVRVEPLTFGTMVPCSSLPGMVTVLPASGARSTAGCIDNATGPVLLGQIRVEPRQSNSSDDVVLSIAVTPTMSNGTGTTMAVDPVKLHNTSGGPSVTPPLTITGSARATYDVGGTLNVKANQAAGSYSGAITISVNCK